MQPYASGQLEHERKSCYLGRRERPFQIHARIEIGAVVQVITAVEMQQLSLAQAELNLEHMASKVHLTHVLDPYRGLVHGRNVAESARTPRVAGGDGPLEIVYLATAEIFAHIPFTACLKRVGDARQVPAESARSLHHSRKGLAVHIEQGIVDHREVTHCMAAGRGRHRHGIKTARRHSFFLMQMVGCVFHSGSQLKRLEEALQRSAHYQGIVPAQGVAVGGVIVDSTVYGEVGVVFVALEGAGII